MLWQSEPTPKIISGETALDELEDHVHGDRILLCSSRSVIIKDEIHQLVNKLGGKKVEVYSGVMPNPSFEEVLLFSDKVSGFQPCAIIAVGGGSVIDFAKILSLLLTNSSYRSIEKLQRLDEKFKRESQLIAIPTTCGTGAEVTPFATVWDKTNLKKYSIANHNMRSDICVLNGNLSRSSSGEQVLYSGLDALSHCVETLWNSQRDSWSLNFAIAALISIMDVFPRLIEGSGSNEDWQIMQESAMFAGLAISQSRTAIAHSISYPLTSHFQIPHGLACSFSIPYIWDSLSTTTKSKIPNSNLLNDATLFIHSLNLMEKVKKYASIDDITAVASEMISSERASNFMEKVDLDWIKRLASYFE